MKDAMNAPHFLAHRVFSRTLSDGDTRFVVLPVPIAAAFRMDQVDEHYPRLGEANADFGFHDQSIRKDPQCARYLSGEPVLERRCKFAFH
jgi:hypothetical protein